MAYFPNGTSQEVYAARFCQRCQHHMPDDGGCAVMMAHILHNYDAVGTDANQALKSVLDLLIPMEGIHPQECAMFLPWDEDRCTLTDDLFNSTT